MRRIVLAVTVVLTALLQISCEGSKKQQRTETVIDSVAEVKVKWKVATIAYTFRKFTFSEAVAKTKALGLGYIGGYPGQAIGGGIEGNMVFTMPAETRAKVSGILRAQGVKLVDFGVVTPASDAEWRKLFEFAKAMEIPTIVSEPRPDQLDMVAGLCEEFGIDVAIHNHPAPSLYTDPDTLAAVLRGRTSRLGACADVGHWVRSGYDPVQSLKKLEGRILELHFKDESEKGRAATEVVWGTGVADVKGMLEELYRQQFSGVLAIEYESKPEDNIKEIEESLDYYETVVKTFR